MMVFTRDGVTVTWHGEVSHRRKGDQQLYHIAGADAGLDIFATPSSLSPPRPCDHRIRLLTGTVPMAVRSYRYPHLQKDEMKRQCKEMLRRASFASHSPFSSPVLLVKKADNSWRFWVELSGIKREDSERQIPDSCSRWAYGAMFFTKLDLTSGYHQIRMDPRDIEMTTFRSHHGHFEFLVMPFALLNAPSTF